MNPIQKSWPRGVSRRTLLKVGLGAGLASFPLPGIIAHAQFKADPFSLGIASGDPADDGFVIWTRLAPDPLGFRGGMGLGPATVDWEVAADPQMKQIVRSGSAIARIELAHAVHVEIGGLEPARDYFYRFRADGAESPIGRSRTLPPRGADVAQVRFASAGCQAWESGYYTAWRRIAEENFDFVCHYGDYIYERGWFDPAKSRLPVARQLPRDFPTCVTLVDYRRRYTLYKGDPDLQAAHASCPFLSSFDDHEVLDNWGGDFDPKDTPAEIFRFRRAAAFQAWYEHMPVRRSLIPRGPDMIAYRKFRVGNLADISVLDTRQYRSKHPCGDGIKAGCAEADEPGRTMMGEQQELWLAEGLRNATATWQILAQQVAFARLDYSAFEWSPSKETGALDLDAWDGASAARDRMLGMLRESRVANPVVLTGDSHMGMAFDIRSDLGDAKSTCAVEFLAPSISSNGDGEQVVPNTEAILARNPHLRFLGNERGYTRHVVTPQRWQADYRVVERVTTPGAPVVTRKSFVAEAGRPGLMDA
jgi:alkaline phosphatase D